MPSHSISFFAIGIPKAQPRARAFARKMGDKFAARVYDAGTAEMWKSDIALAARDHLPRTPLTGPLRVDIDFIFPRPKYLLKKSSPDGEIMHISKPDRDNSEKALTDCLTRLRMWEDDCQICEGEVRKFYAAKNAPSGARIRITPLSESKPSTAAPADNGMFAEVA